MNPKRLRPRPILRLSWDQTGDLAARADQQGVLDDARQPQERPPGMRDDLPDGIEQQEAQPLRPGGPEISG
jgi:hypothetical protein